jgi:hypothetical protein
MNFRHLLTMPVPALAAKVGRDRTWIYRVIEGKSNCGKKVAQQIEAATGGAILAKWLLGLEPAPEPPGPDHASSEERKAS